jgi:hypothetical protein
MLTTQDWEGTKRNPKCNVGFIDITYEGIEKLIDIPTNMHIVAVYDMLHDSTVEAIRLKIRWDGEPHVSIPEGCELPILESLVGEIRRNVE